MRNAAPMRAHWSKSLPGNSCKEAVEFARTFESIDECWSACERGDWMLWLLGRLSGSPESQSRKLLVLCACSCARLALPYVTEGEKRPRLAIETAERWACGDEGVSLDDVRAAAYAAADAANAADAAASVAYTAVYAAYTAADAAADAANAAYAAANVANAAYTAANAANAAANAAASAAKAAVLRECANIVRKHYPDPPSLEVNHA